ncbi:MAG: branched-chain amino acid aminotransferase [Rhodospirillaceae bacterium]|nr:branched-chain amino acid aminotransferase [Rhodospirillaceae bacterium]
MAGQAGPAQTYVNGEWLEGNPKLLGPMTHAMWLASLVFDGARAFEGVAPDLDLHCERVVRSARALGLGPTLSAGEIVEVAQEGVARFPVGTALYIRPMFWAEGGFVDNDPDTTQFALSVYASPFPDCSGAKVAVSTKRRPTPETAPTQAKAACLYPQAGLAMREAKGRGFENAIMLDTLGHVAEFATANIFIAKDGAVHTPVPNGTFLDGITRQRVIRLLRAEGMEVLERTVSVEDVMTADEVFSTGNYAKLMPITRVEDRDYQPGPVYTRARKLYWDYAHG